MWLLRAIALRKHTRQLVSTLDGTGMRVGLGLELITSSALFGIEWKKEVTLGVFDESLIDGKGYVPGMGP